MRRYCDRCDREIEYEATIYELRIENKGQKVLERETLCEPCLSDKY